ncbi:MAG: cysteine desulfurase family protein [Pirellulaceae bacterium]
MTNESIYLDNHATTPCDPQVVEAMLPFLMETFGNPHSTTHAVGREAEAAMQSALDQIAQRLHTSTDEIVITSGATESTNLAILGYCRHPRNRKRHVITVATEHPAVLDPIAQLSREGFRVTTLDVDSSGLLDVAALADAIDDDTALISVMLANNEIGSIQPLAEIVRIAHQRDVAVHTDATQAIGRIPVDVSELQVDLLSCSAHKFYGPKGVGLLNIRQGGRRVRVQPLFYGGGQQRRIRPGTMNPAAVVGMATALRLATDGISEEAARIGQLRDALWKHLSEGIPGLQLNGPSLTGASRLPGNLNVRLPGVTGEAIMLAAADVAVSSGSACTSGDTGPSHVLRSIGLSEQEAHASLRFGVGRFNDRNQVDDAAERLIRAYRSLVAASPWSNGRSVL